MVESPNGHSAFTFHGKEAIMDNFIEMYLRPPSASEEARINDWIKVRQSVIRYYLSLGDQRIVDKNYIIRPKAEFEVGRMTLGGLLALGYTVVVSYKRASTSVSNGNVSMSLETIDSLGETYMVLRGTNRKTVGAEASKMGINGPWITKSYLEMILETKGVPRINTPPLPSNATSTSSQEKLVAAPKPLRITPNIVNRLEDLSQPWTRSPTKSKMEPVLATWHFISPDPPLVEGSVIETDPSFRDTLHLAPMPDSYDLDRGLLLAVQAIQALLENKGLPVIVGIAFAIIETLAPSPTCHRRLWLSTIPRNRCYLHSPSIIAALPPSCFTIALFAITRNPSAVATLRCHRCHAFGQ
ncbi:uridine,cytidine kinase [Sarracenia purpurea var. burkii]